MKISSHLKIAPLASCWVVTAAVIFVVAPAASAPSTISTTAEAQAETAVPEHLSAVPGEDLEKIRRAALDYAESWYAGDRDQIERALHPDLCKRIVRRDESRDRSRVDHMSAMTLAQGVAKGWGKRTPPEERQKDVKILDVYRSAATVRLEMRGWVDFMHIGKVDGEWKIINVLWDTKPRDE